ncbi:MAG: MarR family transcriptional regulator [Candidatus Cloacimonadaceae bacterium]|jgi:DNA-binding MarR family transcriptional regulator|nr:MarR family transcriptional regulator [Candidatus Cloacimonadota bacterium]MCB5257680.1 MarR family transcriptional regulator [Candidatus Cloacimonadota bacterium]MDD5624576.1 MarR family transcriptional regulator [Candidatus Cloacimonadota bacterium]MDY0111634.1 MarR family transcriptional regulator [Candidatus Syntrophosphaera sp.]
MKVRPEDFHNLITRLQIVLSEIDYAQKACLQAGKMECQLLNYLYNVQKPVNMNELARELNVSHSRITRIMDNLVNKNLVIRKPSDEDRRCWYAIITDKGKKLAENSRQTVLDHQKKIMSMLSDKEVENIFNALQTYIDKYEQVLKNTKMEIE